MLAHVADLNIVGSWEKALVMMPVMLRLEYLMSLGEFHILSDMVMCRMEY